MCYDVQFVLRNRGPSPPAGGSAYCRRATAGLFIFSVGVVDGQGAIGPVFCPSTTPRLRHFATVRVVPEVPGSIRPGNPPARIQRQALPMEATRRPASRSTVGYRILGGRGYSRFSPVRRPGAGAIPSHGSRRCTPGNFSFWRRVLSHCDAPIAHHWRNAARSGDGRTSAKCGFAIQVHFSGKSVVPRAGIEPATRGFSIRCSTN